VYINVDDYESNTYTMRVILILVKIELSFLQPYSCISEISIQLDYIHIYLYHNHIFYD